MVSALDLSIYQSLIFLVHHNNVCFKNKNDWTFSLKQNYYRNSGIVFHDAGVL